MALALRQWHMPSRSVVTGQPQPGQPGESCADHCSLGLVALAINDALFDPATGLEEFVLRLPGSGRGACRLVQTKAGVAGKR
jgi:hypothetical protein